MTITLLHLERDKNGKLVGVQLKKKTHIVKNRNKEVKEFSINMWVPFILTYLY
jgi:hypothetical protein